MFDIGFWELLLIAVLALFVVGPERLPGFVRETSRKISEIRRFIYHSRKEIEQQLEIYEQQELTDKINEVEQLVKNAPDKISREILDKQGNLETADSENKSV